MALAAAQMVDAVAARLVLVPATAGRVYTSRAWPLAEDGLPCWRVVAADEEIELVSFDGLERHQLDIEATAYARAVADLDDTLHALASAGLSQIYAATPNAAYAVQTTGIQRRLTSENEAALGLVTLRLRVKFHTHQSDPDTLT